jgi:hypothetical protein
MLISVNRTMMVLDNLNARSRALRKFTNLTNSRRISAFFSPAAWEESKNANLFSRRLAAKPEDEQERGIQPIGGARIDNANGLADAVAWDCQHPVGHDLRAHPKPIAVGWLYDRPDGQLFRDFGRDGAGKDCCGPFAEFVGLHDDRGTRSAKLPVGDDHNVAPFHRHSLVS